MVGADKILSVQQLPDRIKLHRDKDEKVVMCHGVFDLLHIGHIRHFEEARSFGDVLIVTLTPDQFVNKGVHRPVFMDKLRAESVAALDVVDYVAINEWPTAVRALHIIRPDIYCKGHEYRQKQVDSESNMLPELVAAEELGIKIEFTKDEIVFSSSELLNRHFSPFSEETDLWLSRFRDQYSSSQVLDFLDGMKGIKVLVVGEAIIDEYVMCTAIGKSTKDPVLACQFMDTQAVAGGSLAVANHLAGFCDEVGLITYLGEEKRREEFVNKELSDKVKPVFLTKKGSPTIHKRRYVDQYTQNKLLELYVMDDTPLQEHEELNEKIGDVVDDYDIVIVMDYGHGMLTYSTIDMLCDRASFLAVNTQSNAGNRGFNPISRYRRADYVCLAHHEVAVETRMREGELRDLLSEVAQNIDCPRFTVTYGKKGSVHYEPTDTYVEVPAFATTIKDRVGAGDAVIAVTSLLLYQEAPLDIVGFIGNVAGAEMVAELGNCRPLSKLPLSKHIISLMK